jgi:hypothetical protein
MERSFDNLLLLLPLKINPRNHFSILEEPHINLLGHALDRLKPQIL